MQITSENLAQNQIIYTTLLTYYIITHRKLTRLELFEQPTMYIIPQIYLTNEDKI